jgi:hypothetical protein
MGRISTNASSAASVTATSKPPNAANNIVIHMEDPHEN